MRRIVGYTAPFIVLLIAWASAAMAEVASDTIQTLIKILPYVIALATVGISIWFQSSNSFYLTCFILITYIMISMSADRPATLAQAVMMTSILLPINTVWLAFSKERGIVSTYGRNKAILITAQLIWIFINILGKSGSGADTGVGEAAAGIGAPAVVLYLLAIGIILVDFIKKQKYMDLIYIVVLLMSYIAFYFPARPVLGSIFTASAFFVILFALLDTSYSMAFYDALTGVLSRRALEQEFLKLGNRYVVGMIDLDHFKRINDNYGHNIGDEVLKMTASVMKKTVGEGKIFRYGGEEFVALYTSLSYNEAIQRLDKMRKAIASKPFLVSVENCLKESPETNSCNTSKGRGTIHVTVSIGVAQKTHLLKTCQDVIRKADEALYQSKKSGRNTLTKA